MVLRMEKSISEIFYRSYFSFTSGDVRALSRTQFHDNPYLVEDLNTLEMFESRAICVFTENLIFPLTTETCRKENFPFFLSDVSPSR